MKKLLIGCFLSTIAITAIAQTCNSNIEVTRPDSRYEIMTGGTEVKDTVTGLIWQRCALGQSWNGSTCTGTPTELNWHDALRQASSLGNEYRLPNIKELQSLTETACYRPAINLTVFPTMYSVTKNDRYWSATPSYQNDSDIAWYLALTHGGIGNRYYEKIENKHVRAVRISSED